MPSFPAKTAELKRQWQRSAAGYDRMSAMMERKMGFAAARPRLLRDLRGRILELGVGTGRNVPFYPAGSVVVAIDLRFNMVVQAREASPGAAASLTFAVADAEDLPFPDAIFDAVVATGVFCCVPDMLHGFREAKRVLKPDGALHLVEHVRPTGLLGFVFDLLDPLVNRMIGPHINRRTVDRLGEAGLRIEREENLFSDWVKLIVAR